MSDRPVYDHTDAALAMRGRRQRPPFGVALVFPSREEFARAVWADAYGDVWGFKQKLDALESNPHTRVGY